MKLPSKRTIVGTVLLGMILGQLLADAGYTSANWQFYAAPAATGFIIGFLL